MKCINCHKDNNLKERIENQGKCKNCGQNFVFEPRVSTDNKITDTFFAKAIADISADNTLFFTSKQFHYFLDKSLKAKNFLSPWLLLLQYILLSLAFTFIFGTLFSFIVGKIAFVVAAILINIIYLVVFSNINKYSEITYKNKKTLSRILEYIGGFLILAAIYVGIVLFNSLPIFIVILILGIVASYLGITQTNNQGAISQSFLISQQQSQDWLNRWLKVQGKINKILSPESEEVTIIPINPEITAYSFDRVVICDQAEISAIALAKKVSVILLSVLTLGSKTKF